MKLCFVILAHDRMGQLANLIKLILSQGCAVCLHLDKKVPEADVAYLREHLEHSNGTLMFAERVHCAWGTYSLVEAVLKAVKKIDDDGYNPDYVYLISGSDIPIKSISSLKEFLDYNRGKEYIESFNITYRPWVKAGLTKERYERYFVFNFQTHRRLFDFSVKIQKLLGIKRTFPASLVPHFGAQWWCLSWQSLIAIYEISKRKEITAFFKKVWIPDELFFQTMIRNVANEDAIVNHSLTFHKFNHQGKPILIYQDQLKTLTQMPYFFARKLSNNETDIFPDLIKIQNNTKKLNQESLKNFGENVYVYESYIHQNKVGNSVIHQKLNKLSNLASLQVNERPYFIIFGNFKDEMVQLSDFLNDFDGIICHQRIFKADEIQFECGTASGSPYCKEDLPLRDYCPPNFLYDLISQQPNSTVGFLCTRDDYRRTPPYYENWLKFAIEFDRNCKVIIIESNVASFLEKENRDCLVNDIFHNYIKGVRFQKEVSNLKSRNKKNMFTIKKISEIIKNRRSPNDIVGFIHGSE